MDNFIVQLIARLDASKTPDDIKKIEQQLNAKGINLKTTLDTATTKQELHNLAKQLQSILKPKDIDIDTSKITSALNQLAQLNKTADSLRINDTITKLNEQLRKNSAYTSEAKNKVKDWINELESVNVSELRLKEINSEMKKLHSNMAQAGHVGKSLKDTLKSGMQSFIEWMTASGAIMEVVNWIRKAVVEFKELDNILTEISKTSDLTANQLEKLGDIAYDSASKYGKRASDYLTGVQEMYRAGFDNAEQMAELSLLAQAAGDMGTDLSNDYIMATNAAYKYKGSIEDLNEVLDSQNYITNNAAISMKDIADATTETASVAAQYGVQIDELSALIATATANTRESGSEVGTALKAILINLQDTTSKPVTETFDALGISMTKVVDGAEQLKTPIELIHELANAYNSLPESDIMRANILNEIGQKRHAKVCVVI